MFMFLFSFIVITFQMAICILYTFFPQYKNISYSLYTEKKILYNDFCSRKDNKIQHIKVYDYLVYGVGIQYEVKIFFTKALYLILSIHRRLFYLSFSKYKKRVMRHWETYDIFSCQVSKIEFKQRYFFRFYQNEVEDEKLSTLLGVWTSIFTNLCYKHQPLYAQTQCSAPHKAEITCSSTTENKTFLTRHKNTWLVILSAMATTFIKTES